jgi:hypothetical protein
MKALLPALLPAWLLCSCNQSDGGPRQANAAAKPVAWTHFSGDRALADVKAVVELGPRPSGSAEIEASRRIIAARLKAAGWEVQRQEFDADHVLHGTVKMANLRARFTVAGSDTWKRPVTALLCSHYDTKWFRGARFVGANDGGSSTGLLLEAARAAAAAPAFAAKLELVFFDGEEAFTDFTEPRGFGDTRYDGLFGSRHYARELRSLPLEQRPRYGVVFDMIGDARLEVCFPSNGSADLTRRALDAARELNLERHFRAGPPIVDDHVPLSWTGMAVIDFIDLESYREFWHTPADTFDKLNPASIEQAGRTGLLFLEKLLAE